MCLYIQGDMILGDHGSKSYQDRNFSKRKQDNFASLCRCLIPACNAYRTFYERKIECTREIDIKKDKSVTESVFSLILITESGNNLTLTT